MSSEPADTGHPAAAEALPRLQEVIGRRARALRLRAGKRQEEIAEAARAVGLNWIRATVAAIEGGQRTLSLEEALLLPHVFSQGVGLREALRLSDFLYAAEGMAALTPTAMARLDVLREAVGQADASVIVPLTMTALLGMVSPDLARTIEAATRDLGPVLRQFESLWPDISAGELVEAERSTRLEAEQKAARRLGVSSLVMAVGSHRLWGRSLTAERDHRVARQGDASPRTVQARRAHMTRALLEEIQSAYPDLKKLDQHVADALEER